jgi:hypothetical protein
MRVRVPHVPVGTSYLDETTGLAPAAKSPRECKRTSQGINPAALPLVTEAANDSVHYGW